MKTIILTGLCLTFLLPLYAQNEVIDEYVRMGLENNLTLKQKQGSYEESIQSLREARGLFYPEVSLNARYSVADGGRIIEFPVGDLLNPVYSTLNTLTASDRFPEIGNEEFRFLRSREHETKLRVVQPVFNPEIIFANQVRKRMTDVERADLGAYRSELVAEIKTAYFNYLKAEQIRELLRSTRELVEENLRVNRKLFGNDKVTRDAVYRSRTEVSRVEQSLAEAEKSVQVARAYMNFLLNRKLDEPLTRTSGYPTDLPSLDPSTARQDAVNRRKEMEMADAGLEVAEKNIRLNNAGRLPSLIAAVDYGFQGTEYRFTDEDDFVLASLVLRWNLFTGFSNRARTQQAVIRREMAEDRKQQLRQSIELEVIRAWHELTAASAKVKAAEDEVVSARSAFKMIKRKYEEGTANLLEFIDARNALTDSETNYIISTYDFQIRKVAFEKAVGGDHDVE